MSTLFTNFSFGFRVTPGAFESLADRVVKELRASRSPCRRLPPAGKGEYRYPPFWCQPPKASFFDPRSNTEAEPSSIHLPGLGEEAPKGLRIGDVLCLKDAPGKVVGGVPIANFDRTLEDDGAAVQAIIDQMNGAARNADPMLPRLFLGMEAGEGG